MAETCITFAAWMPYALLAALGIGVGIGTLIRLGIDRVQLAAYRRVARLPVSTEAELDETMRALESRQWRERARRISE